MEKNIQNKLLNRELFKIRTKCLNNMKSKLLNSINKILIITILILLVIHTQLLIGYTYASSDNIEIVSKAALLVDNNTNKILYSKNADTKMYPASTTKILTAILVLENSKLDEVLTVSYDAIMTIPEGYSTAHLQIGEQLTVEQLLKLLLVCSANDAANVLAEYVGGSVESFVAMMNTKANEIGLTNSHFTNAYGLHDENHYTTASDLALLMKYCIENEDFRKISGSASCAIPATNKYGTRLYNSTNELIIPNSKHYYPYVTAGKTGFTSQAGDCLVSCAYKDNLELICVVLDGKTINNVSSRFSDTVKLYNYGYENYSIKTIVQKNDVLKQVEVKKATTDTKNLDLLSSDTLVVLMKKDTISNNITPEITLNTDIKAPIKEGQIIGTAKYTIDNEVYNIELIAAHDVENSKIFEYVLPIFIIIAIFIVIYKVFLSRKK